MMVQIDPQSVVEFLVREAEFVDEKRWDEWLELFTADAEYWMPAWDSETETTSDPNDQISLIYYDSRAGLEDRVFRLRTNASSASTPLPRTVHFVTNVRVSPSGDGTCAVKANFQTLLYRHDTTVQYYGFYEYRLVPHASGWRIRKKKIVVLNDRIPAVLDFYSV
jgi:anthranilate 1,2-dioxygenase small subunit